MCKLSPQCSFTLVRDLAFIALVDIKSWGPGSTGSVKVYIFTGHDVGADLPDHALSGESRGRGGWGGPASAGSWHTVVHVGNVK